MKTFLVGYGSLINKKSKDATHEHHGDMHPVTLSGFSRGWWLEGRKRNATALTIKRDPLSSMNGVLVEIDAQSLPHFDEREKSYERVPVTLDQLKFHDQGLAEDAQIYTYVREYPEGHRSKFPIFQRYLDLVIKGCLDVSEEFALEFVNTTHAWDQDVLNERDMPQTTFRYIEPETELIDEFLAKHTDIIERRVDTHTVLEKLKEAIDTKSCQ